MWDWTGCYITVCMWTDEQQCPIATPAHESGVTVCRFDTWSFGENACWVSMRPHAPVGPAELWSRPSKTCTVGIAILHFSIMKICKQRIPFVELLMFRQNSRVARRGTSWTVLTVLSRFVTASFGDGPQCAPQTHDQRDWPRVV